MGERDLPLRHHAARRRADAGRRFLGRRQDRHRAGARPARHRLHRGRLARRQPDRRRLLRRSAGAHAAPRFTAFGMTRRPGRSAANDPGLAGLLGAKARGRLHGRQDLGLPCRCGARRPARREPRHDRARASPLIEEAQGRGAVRRRAFLRRLQGQSRLRARLPARRRYEAGARWIVLCDTNGGTLPRRGRAHRRARWRSGFPATSLGIHATTTPRTPSPTRWPRCAPARGRCRAR